MSDPYPSGSYSYPYTTQYPTYAHNPAITQNYYQQPQRTNYDFKASNLSQQTIIHRTRLFSPEKNQQFVRKKPRNNDHIEKTKSKKSEITAKIHQIVDLCENDRNQEIEEFKDVIVAEKRILSMLQSIDQSEQQIPNIHLNSIAEAHHDRGTTFGPIRNDHRFEITKIHSNQQTQRQTPSNLRNTISNRENIYKKSAIDDLKTDRNLQESVQPIPQFEGKRVEQENQDINNCTENIIQSIQKKAVEEIESLRNDKLQLMRRLNQQIRAHNEEKKLRIRLQQQLSKYRGIDPRNENAQLENQYQINQKVEHKYYSQPHFQYTRNPGIHQGIGQQYQQNPQQSNGNPNQNQNRGKPIKHHQLHQQQLKGPHYQYEQMQQQNKNLRKTIKYNNSSQKQYLRQQVAQLNRLVHQYQRQIQRLRRSSGMSEVRQLQQLLMQGQHIQMQTGKLLKGNTNNGRRQENNENLIEKEAKIFKRRLNEVENENRRSKTNLNSNYNQSLMGGYQYGKAYSRNANRLSQFENILRDLKSAAR